MEDENKKDNVDTQTTPDKAQNNQKQEQKAENKSEGEKTKKQVAQKGEDGSIVFKNQDELDGFIRRMYAKGAEKAEQGEKSKHVQETQNKQEEQEQEEQEEVVQTDYTDKIALAMAKAGVDVKKAERAARLVDMSKVLDGNNVSATKLEEEINAVIAEFPELKVAKEDEKDEKGFKFGASQEASNNNQKQTKPVATKRWNRFNQI